MPAYPLGGFAYGAVMETTEKIVEAYVRYVLGCATIPNIRCKGGLEIDLLAINPSEPNDRYHIETSVSVSRAFSKLTAGRLDAGLSKAQERRTVEYFDKRKFKPVIDQLRKYGFEQGNYRKVVVSSGWTDEAADEARKADIELWDFRKDVMQEIERVVKHEHSYFTDDTLRTIHLYVLAAPNSGDSSG